MRLSELGEFGLIDLIRSTGSRYKTPCSSTWQEILVGIGDDAAAWQDGSQIQLATTDTLVQDVHFNLNIITWQELGRKALAVNLSDIAAMGGIPKYALLSLALPAQLEVEDVSKLIDGMMRLAAEFEVAVVGGNVAVAPNVVITITVIGSAKGRDLLRRSTASPGQQVAVTGYLGLSAAGLTMLKGKTISDVEASSLLRRSHLDPTPRVKEGQILIEQGVRTAIDISDGLLADLGHICEASGVGATVKLEQVPIHPVVMTNFPSHDDLALSGGEDYELLFTAEEAIVDRVRQALDCPVTVIGNITDGLRPAPVMLVDRDGSTIAYKKGGWNHFKNGIYETDFE
jgi:thiamine-monophosphate kinase